MGLRRSWVQGGRHLFAKLIYRITHTINHCLTWSRWRAGKSPSVDRPLPTPRPGSDIGWCLNNEP
jgi:hypothetical protein